VLKGSREKKDLASDACRQAEHASGLAPADFKAKFASKLGCFSVSNNDGKNPCPVRKPECASTSNNDENNPCANRTTKPDCASASNHDETNPCATKPSVVTTGALKECLTLRGTMHGLSAGELIANGERLNTVCRQAWAESRLSAGEFWSKH